MDRPTRDRCQQRAVLLEWMDTPGISDEGLAAVYGFFERTDRWTGGTRPILTFLKKCSAHWSHNRPISILDLYCGRGALSRAILKSSLARSFDLHILAVDRYGRIVEMAREKQSSLPHLSFDVRDWNHPSFLHGQQVDYVVSHLSLHHIDDSQCVPFLKRLRFLARRGFIVSDWIRSYSNWLWIRSLSYCHRNEAIRHDGPLSVERGFTPDEIKALVESAELEGVDVATHWGSRFTISSDRGLALAPAKFSLAPAP